MIKTFLTFFILSSSSVFAAENDVYYCFEDLRYRNSEDNTDVKEYQPQKFQFKRTSTKLIFGNQKNWFQDVELEIIFSGGEVFTAAGESRDSDIVKYNNGKFFYSYVSFEDITSVVASCSTY